jgi:phosphoribosylformylglycinamidine cyclo-ligase
VQISYEDSGVSIQAGNMLTEILNREIKSDNIGNFAGLYEHPYIPEYYLAGCTDGVGTKVIPLAKRGLVETIATDLIAMNLNDLICTGAKPMFFLDYFATNKLDVEITSKFVLALRNELAKYDCTLLGGETAELGSLIQEGHFDVGGFMVGIVRKDLLLKRENVEENDVIIALKSSGPHSNGYSLVRALNDNGQLSDGLFEMALEPTHIYANEINEIVEKGLAHACANITGGGIEDNLVRSIPNGKCAVVDKSKIIKQELFEKLQELVGEDEAYRAFNMGVGFCIIAPQENFEAISKICAKYEPTMIGYVTCGNNKIHFGKK